VQNIGIPEHAWVFSLGQLTGPRVGPQIHTPVLCEEPNGLGFIEELSILKLDITSLFIAS
jgi:hypothetical protein